MISALILLCGIAVCALSGWLIYDVLNVDVITTQSIEPSAPASKIDDKKPLRFEIIGSIYDNKSAS
ncbi:MAG: hypothetical protein K0R34_4322 [Herbinix sp.]|jgi:hypothetical protein|nr:hypothetical protein [Herbinix sp.]